MNCDQAFERMTDPETEGDVALESHLQQCPRCRDMAEILEPALRFVTGNGDGTWLDAGWELPQRTESQAAKPFLSPQAVRAAEEAAAALTAKKSRRAPDSRSRWLAAALLTPLVVLALVVADRIESDTREQSPRHFTLPEIGPCIRERAARTSPSDDEKEMFTARNIVLSCNACHLLDSPTRFDRENHLKLRPAEADENAKRRRGAVPETDAGLPVLLWSVATLPSQNRAC